jgi:PAS domain S-box-containing protein/diguanylate cyclase (GGDEF)-like protein
MTDNDGPAKTETGPALMADEPDGALSAITGRVVLWYALLATVWIVASDLVFGASQGESPSEQVGDVAKGLVFVGVSASILWGVLQRLTRSFDERFARTVTEQRDFYQSILHTSSDMILIFEADARILYANHAITDILGWSPDEVVGREGLTLLHPDERTSATSFRENAARLGRNRRIFQMLHRDGTYRFLEITVSSIALDGGRAGAIVNGRDVTERTRGEQQLRAALAEDAMGLPNLRMFVTEMERLDEVSVVGLSAVVLLVDVDRFGDINSLHGRAAGDAVLLELTRRMEATVPEAIGMWRHGADEILLVLLDSPADPDGSGTRDMQELVERIHREASAPMALDDTDQRLSVGVAVGLARVLVDRAPDGEALSSRMLRAVEHALAEAKGHPDRSAVHTDRRARSVDERARLVAELHEAVARGELITHFQPKVRLSDLAVVGAEALVRWEHPERGLLLPGDFLRTVEEANLSAGLTRIVLGASLAEVQAWLDVPGCDPDFVLCVNFSLDDLRRKHFADDVFAALEASGVEPRHLCLELTEQTMLADALGASTVVAELRRAGLRIAIDDFGTGYSSLEHIRVFEVDELKIDKGFVQRIGGNRADEAIVDSIIAIAGRLGLQVTAEGIEDVEALDYLLERGCHQGQGFLFSPAVPAAEFSSGRSYAPLR